MSALPKACPYCGQALLNEEAIAQLHLKEEEIEADGRRLERELRTRATVDARKAARAEIVRKVAAAVSAESKKAERLLARLDKTSGQLAELREQRQEILRGQTAEIAGVRREVEAQKKRDIREALRRQREGDRARISREERARVERTFSRQAKRAAKTHEAAYAVLVSRKFPRGQKNLLVRGDGVIVVHPALLLHVAHVVRRMVEEVHRAGLGAAGRAGKTEELYAYLRSERFKHSLGSIANATASLKEMLDSERDAHSRTWSRREKSYNEIRENSSTIDEEIRLIVERPIRSRKAKIVPIAGAR